VRFPSTVRMELHRLQGRIFALSVVAAIVLSSASLAQGGGGAGGAEQVGQAASNARAAATSAGFGRTPNRCWSPRRYARPQA
jgi:hypothetical protein